MTHVRVAAAEAELAADALFAAGAHAVEERDNGDGTITLVADAVPVGWAHEEVPVGDDGLDGWRPYARVERAGDHIVVRPPWVEPAAGPGDIELVIDPGRAFGSGSHATTRLALAALERLVEEQSTVLDVGCGSGVLAVAAARLGARSVLAIDIDPAAITATRDNAAVNAVSDRVVVDERPLDAVERRASIVVANISAAVLRDLAGALGDHVVPGGRLVLTGVLDGQLDDVVAAFASHAVETITREDGWACVELR
jgi:ribosomal protein L11 methyltransferase